MAEDHLSADAASKAPSHGFDADGDRDLPQWLIWARELQAISQTGLAYSAGEYDRQRYARLMEIAGEIVACHDQAGADMTAADWTERFLAHPGYATPKVDVRGACVREGKILLVQEKQDGRWCMPGGWADVGDLPSEMVTREVREESGLIVAPRKVIGVFDANRGGRPLEFFHAYKIVFLCEILAGEATPGDEILAARFFAFANLPPLSSARTNERHLAEVEAHLADSQRAAAFD
jgi:ADP-ribose pyrophosphatase YjhB (NUDIX family)